MTNSVDRVLRTRGEYLPLLAMILAYASVAITSSNESVFLLHSAALISGCVFLRRTIVNDWGKGLSLLVYFSGCLIALTVQSIIVDWDRVVARDFLEIGKYTLILAACAFGYALCDWRAFYRCFVILAVASIFVGALQILEVEFVLDNLVRDKDVLVGKPIAFFWTTYFAAAMYLFLASIVLANIVTTREFHVPSHILFVVLCAMVVFTQSRTAFLSLCIVVAAYTLYWLSRKFVLTTTVMAILVLAVAFAMLSGSFSAVAENFSYLADGLRRYLFNWRDYIHGDNSLGMRFSQLSWAIKENGFILIGRGVGKGYRELLESWPALYYYRFGLAGMLFYIFIWFRPLAFVFSLRRGGIHVHMMSPFILSAALFTICLPALALSSSITDQVHLAGVMYVLLGAAYRAWDNKRNGS